ncbi:dCTP deaminase [Sulfurovum sp.]|uniref:dCTP deaminase n=1 Tax=Sulfurovum sp. TaxID=1969726 RepID=UPI0025E7F835|nr:dCTP deaminase [Sulfurovum sp.]
MVLNDKSIIKYIEKKEIYIQPFSLEYVRPSSYCMTLNKEIFIFEKTDNCIKLFDEKSYPKYKIVVISKSNPYILSPGEFILASTNEYIGLSNKFTGFLSNISGLARLGLNVLLSTHIASGFGFTKKKQIILEMHNNSNCDIEIIPDIRICHLVFVQNISKSTKGYDHLYPEKYIDNKLSEYYK